jgi:hypothetical protein
MSDAERQNARMNRLRRIEVAARQAVITLSVVVQSGLEGRMKENISLVLSNLVEAGNWTGDELSDDIELEIFAKAIDTWDGNDLNTLLPTLHRYQAWLREHPECDGIFNEKDYAVSQALARLTERADVTWPLEWAEESCPFAWAVDRQGNYLTREFRGAPQRVAGAFLIEAWPTDDQTESFDD